MLSTLNIENSPFSEQQLKQLQSSIGDLNPAQSQWLSGYMAGRLAGNLQATVSPQSENAPAASLAIIYATETGNSKAIATGLAASVEQQGIGAELHSMDSFRPAALRKLKNVAFVISTHGEGDPPDEALELFDYLESERAPQLNELNYRILALGDRSYELFCEAGRRLEKRLQSLEDSGLVYQPGDALGIWAPNDPDVVGQMLGILQIVPAEPIRCNDQDLSISEALTFHLEITRLTSDTVTGFAAAGGGDQLGSVFSGFEPARQREFIEQRQLADLVEAYPSAVSPQALVDLLRPLTPRSYSIASSQQMVDEEVHLTVATLHSDAIGVPRHGVASGYLNNRLGAGGQVKVFLEPNDRFRLPDDPETPIIMIAAGTGIAPYRSFMQELESQRANPDSWLIFGNPHLRTDFLYQREWLRWRESGLLNRIDTAWSRDQAEKHYVQDVVQAQAARIDRWLQRGGHIYLCGSQHMGQAVQDVLQNALPQPAATESEPARSLLTDLRRERRLHKDLY